jgi:hypothetical protein
MEFPECMKRRGGPEVEGQYAEDQMNGQRCHRIAHHAGNCLFDREPEFVPVREEARPWPGSTQAVDAYIARMLTVRSRVQVVPE